MSLFFHGVFSDSYRRWFDSGVYTSHFFRSQVSNSMGAAASVLALNDVASAFNKNQMPNVKLQWILATQLLGGFLHAVFLGKWRDGCLLSHVGPRTYEGSLNGTHCGDETSSKCMAVLGEFPLVICWPLSVELVQYIGLHWCHQTLWQWSFLL